MHIPHSRPTFGTGYQHVVTQILKSSQVTQGDETQYLEHDIQQHLGNTAVLAVDSGTSALMLAIRGLSQNNSGIRVGIPSYACASLLFAVKAAGAEPIFIDCNAQLGLDESQVIEAVKTLDILVLVHPFGLVEPLVTTNFPCFVIEDIAQSVGATIDGKQVGTFGDVTIGSLHATKPWGGVYGGFIASNNADLVKLCASMTNPDQTDICSAYAGHHQLSNVHASLARQRIQDAPHAIEQRQFWAQKYDALLAHTSATPIQPSERASSNHFRYIVRSQKPAETTIANLQTLNIIAARPVQQPLHHSNPAITCPQAEKVWEHCISLPLLSDMSAAEFQYIQQGIQQCFHS